MKEEIKRLLARKAANAIAAAVLHSQRDTALCVARDKLSRPLSFALVEAEYSKIVKRLNRLSKVR